MTKKIFAFLTALSLMTSVPITAVSAAGKEEAATTETTATPTDELIEDITGDEIVSLEEFLERNEELQAQIDEIRQLFEDNGYNIDGLNGNVENLNGEIDGLQMSLNDLYSLINALQAQQRSSSTSSVSGGSSGSPAALQQTSPKPPPTTITTTTTTAEPNTEPNGYLVEKVEKYPKERDFITVATRDGHVFYIVIDYEGENQNVYFLNTVDTADLKHLLEGNSTVTTTFTVESENKTTETKAEETTKEAKKDKKEKNKNSNTVLYIIGGIAIVVFVFIAKKKVGSKKKFNDDEDIGDDYTEEEPEVYVNEDNQEDNYDE